MPTNHATDRDSNGKSWYSEKLLHPKWQKKRLKVLKHARFRCQLCGNDQKTLHVHHSYYVSGRDPWDYPTGSMVSLCESCHKATEGRKAGAAKKPVSPKAPKPAAPETHAAPSPAVIPQSEAEEWMSLVLEVARKRRPLIAMWVQMAVAEQCELARGDNDATFTMAFRQCDSLARDYCMQKNNREFLESVIFEYCACNVSLLVKEAK